MDAEADNLVRLATAKLALRRHFIGWQCRLRQHAAREGDGRPSDGARPEIVRSDGASCGRVTTVLNRSPEHAATAELRFAVQRTAVPLERWEAAMRLFQGGYFSEPERFGDELTALFAPGSALATALLAAGALTLRFRQFGQVYALPCATRELAPGDDLFEATWWHNALFNPDLPAAARILAFRPDWRTAVAEPMPTSA